MRKQATVEPLWWSFFSIGGLIAALVVPVLIFIDGFAVPLNLIEESAFSYQNLQLYLQNSLVEIFFFIIIVFPLFHAAHRIRFSLYELGVREFSLSIDFICYGFATVCAIVTALILYMI